MSRSSPSVSGVLLTHDCAAYVAEALRGALAQDGEPMDLVVSDDASTDGTDEIVRRELAAYGGPHRVTFRRRATNSGSKSAHLNDVLPTLAGEIVLTFDGDDVSEPHRVRRLAETFARDPRVRAVFSSYTLVDERGRPRGRARVLRPPPGADAGAWFARVDVNASGTTLAVRREVVERFGPLAPDVYEDIQLPFRASLLGDVVYLDEDLVRARRRAGSLTAGFERFASLEAYRARMLAGIEHARRNLESRLADLETARAAEPGRASEFERLRAAAVASLADAEATADLSHPAALARARALVRVARSGAYRAEFAQNAWLALAPTTYLAYKRRKLGATGRIP